MSTVLLILFFLGFVSLTYSSIVLIKRKEYENKRIYSGYNALIFGVILLALSMLMKTLKFAFLTFDVYADSLVYLDIASNLVLAPLFIIALLVAMMILKEV